MTRQELEDRLIDLVVLINQVANLLQRSIGRIHYSNQIIRSSSSSALNYGEALSAESKKDFIHKVKIVLKELRETYVALRIILSKETKLKIINTPISNKSNIKYR